MKYFLIYFFLFNLLSGRLSAGQDTLSHPSWKTNLQGSLSLITGIHPTEGRFYKNQWYEHGEPHILTGGFQAGVNAAKRISKRTYLLSGAEISWFKIGEFRMSEAHDSRYTNPNAIIFDTTYTDYTQMAMHVPLCIIFPLLASNQDINWQLGIMNDFTFSESYTINCTQSGNGAADNTLLTVHHDGMHYTATRLHASLRYDSMNNRTLIMFASGITTGPVISNHQNENFLRYSLTVFFRFGVGYSF